MDEIEQMLISLTCNLINIVAKSDRELLNCCTISLFLFPTQNAVLTTCRHEDFMIPEVMRNCLKLLNSCIKSMVELTFAYAITGNN